MPRMKPPDQSLAPDGAFVWRRCRLRKLVGSKCQKFIGIAALVWLAQAATPPVQQAEDSSRWATFTSRGGWSIKYPANLTVRSCRQCMDLAGPDVFVTFSAPSTDGLIMIEPLIDKPADQSVERWLNAISQQTVANPRVSEEWIYLDGLQALKVKNRSPDSSESENVYVVNGSKTFAIRASNAQIAPFYMLYRQMLSTFRFTATLKTGEHSPAKVPM